MTAGDRLYQDGFCLLRGCLPRATVEACRDAFLPVLTAYLAMHRNAPNCGPARHFLPMSFSPACFSPDFFFNESVLAVIQAALGERIVADQWGCDVPLTGSTAQGFHVDYRRPLFPETPGLVLPPYALVVSFGLVDITPDHGPIEIALGTHRLSPEGAVAAVEAGEIVPEMILMNIGDVLIRHPWALHRGTPNITGTPRPLVSIRYVRKWYWDDSREVEAMPTAVWESLTCTQQALLRFPIV